MAGRLVTLYDRVQLASSDDGKYIGGQRVMPSDVRWKCAVICGYNSTHQPQPSVGNEFAVVQLHVNEVSVWEARLQTQTFVDALTVLPWGDGLRFTENEKVGWNIFFLAQQSIWSSTFIGARI